MHAKPFHLAWFGNFTAPVWNEPWAGNDAKHWTNGRFYLDLVQSLERAGFDYMMIEDSLMVPDIYAGTAELELKHARYAPKLDPIPLAALMTHATSSIGIVTTLSTTFNAPFSVARAISTIDHLSEGRAGWNVVTSSEDRAAQNFGMEKLPDHDLRYDIAAEFVQVVRQLWESWEPDAIVMDHAQDIYTDYKRVRTIDFEGEWFRCRGPLNTPRPPQGQPVICQAGGSPKGRAFAAANADTLLASPRGGVAALKEYRDDIRARAAAIGRNPDDIKVMFVISPILGTTDQEARDRLAFLDAQEEKNIEINKVHLAATMEVDLSPFPLDEPLPTESISTNGHQSSLDGFLRAAQGKTLREATRGFRRSSVELVGSPATVAAQMDEIMQEVGGDGFLISCYPPSRRYINEICEGLVPELQKRGLTREQYTHTTLRENLQAF